MDFAGCHLLWVSASTALYVVVFRTLVKPDFLPASFEVLAICLNAEDKVEISPRTDQIVPLKTTN